MGGWIPEEPGRYPGRPGVSMEGRCEELLAMPTAEARGFHVSLWLNDAVKQGVSRDQVAHWVGQLARRWPEASCGLIDVNLAGEMRTRGYMGEPGGRFPCRKGDRRERGRRRHPA